MSNRDIFSKHIPNIKLATIINADGKEIQVEQREDKEQNTKQQKIFDILFAAGYFRAKIKGISPFDKIVGGMTWCIDACDYDVDVDLLFNENLTIGQKISLTEKIVGVLPKMKCPFQIEPHQIQGLDYINIFPVIQWLVKKSVENRAEKAEKLKEFAISQFHNHFQLQSDLQFLQKIENGRKHIKKVEDIYRPQRQYKRKEIGNEDEITRVRITLLEYGNKGLGTSLTNRNSMDKFNDNLSEEIDNNSIKNEIDVDQLLKNLYVAHEEQSNSQLSEKEKVALKKYYKDLKSEMEIDTKELSEQSKIEAILNTKTALEKKAQRYKLENEELEEEISKLRRKINDQKSTEAIYHDEIKMFELNEINADKTVLDKIRNMVLENEELKNKEVQYKENCRNELVRLQQELKKAEEFKPEFTITEAEQTLTKEKEQLQDLRLQLAKKNRGIFSIQRQLDNIPDRTELAQYQRRFLELYNQVSAKHRETKQFYTLYNTLDDTKLYLEKELTLLNSIYENYNEGMININSREQFIKQFELIVEGVKQTQIKVYNKCENEKSKRDKLTSQLMELIELQRKYATAVKQLTKECQRNETLLANLKSIE